MDSILTLILIWVVISLLNYFSKRLKKAVPPKPTVTPPSPVKAKSEIPPFLREIFNIPEEKLPTSSTPPMEARSGSEESEYSIERESNKEFKKRNILEEKSPPPGVEQTISQPLTVSIPAAAKLEMQQTFKKFGSLREAIIWKEILDKPISKRPFRYWRRN